ncbi:hypothetical protein Taro_045620 [Colocasia esculenta]|uniref:Uncharacterized protein n=1 Tax=Colocasia esculenta TaxID=4460 RepID=A0A843WPY9_COLES|nr:hypothetical protein [Colocasia esculenta]
MRESNANLDGKPILSAEATRFTAANSPLPFLVAPAAELPSWTLWRKPAPTARKRSEKEVKAPNLIERAKEEIEAVMHSREKIHTKETHGMSDDIDENTPLDRVKGPSVFERAKEEIEALVQTIHPKKEPDHRPTQVKEGGFWRSLGEALQRFCSPFARKRD